MTTTSAGAWAAFRRGDPDAREAVLTDFLGLVHAMARKVARRMTTSGIDYDELVSAGTVGLIQAAENFDPDRGIAFSTFATPRIRGAILDELRRLDHVPRSVRRKARALAAARDSLAGDLGREPEDGELADHLGIDLETLWEWQAVTAGAVEVSLDRRAAEENGDASVHETLAADGPDTEERITREEEVRYLRDALLRLKEQERIVISLYHYEELKLHEIASMLDLTESRISQIRTQALRKLRAEMAVLREGVA